MYRIQLNSILIIGNLTHDPQPVAELQTDCGAAPCRHFPVKTQPGKPPPVFTTSLDCGDGETDLFLQSERTTFLLGEPIVYLACSISRRIT